MFWDPHCPTGVPVYVCVSATEAKFKPADSRHFVQAFQPSRAVKGFRTWSILILFRNVLSVIFTFA